MGNGGPDAFGYRWMDSDYSLCPPFSWVDITGVGTAIPFNGDDQNSGAIALPFVFPFYGNNFSSVRVCTNGWLSFTSALTTFTNTALPSGGATAPENLLAAFWDDLTFSSAGDAYHYYDGSKFIVSWVAVPRLTSGGPYTFQVILYPSGTIDFQYQNMQGTRLNEATIGIQNATKDVGTQVVFNANYVKDNLRIRFSRAPGWVTVSPASGTIAAGAPPDTVLVSGNATGLADGDYAGQVRITSNDLDEGLTTIPVNLHVGVAASTLAVNPNTLNRNSQGNFVSIAVTPPNPILPPNPIEPEQILTSSLLLQRSVPVDPQGPVDYEDGIAYYKFDRAALLEILPEGDAVPIELIGEVEDLTWFAATDEVRLLKPHFQTVFTPNGRTRLPIGSNVSLQWTDPVGHTPASYDMSFSADGGATWIPVFTGITDRHYQWTVPAWSTDHGMLELVAVDAAGPMGVWLQEDVEILPGVTGIENQIPKAFALKFAGQNPAPGRANIELALPTASPVDVRVHDVRGAVIRHLAEGSLEAGVHRLPWDGRDEGGRRVPAGVYFVSATAGRDRGNVRVVMLR